jgi:pyrroline-5-carboxylate reductase
MTVVSPIPPGPRAELHREIISNIFSSIGRCRFLNEKHFDACTALSASGPAFACIVLEAMADGGVMMGLPRAEALELACQSRSFNYNSISKLNSNILALQGTARMALQPGAHPAQIRDAVTSWFISDILSNRVEQKLAPGGCTIAGLLAMEDGRIRSTIARAIQVATERASELGQPSK